MLKEESAESPIPYSVRIRDINEKGQGVGKVEGPHLEGKVAFVDGSLPGELIQGRVKLEKVRYLVLDLDRILEASPDRIESDCPYFPLCGSCQLRHMTYEAELVFKEKRVRDALTRQGPLSPTSAVFKPILGMNPPFHYRGKSIFPVQEKFAEDGSRQILIGQYRRGSHDLVDLETCQIHHPAALALVNRVRELIQRDQVSLYDEKRGQGSLRHLVARLAPSSRELMVIFVTTDRKQDEILASWTEELNEVARSQGMELKSVWTNVQEERGNRIMSDRYFHLAGAPSIQETIREVSYKISPSSFFQVNPSQADLLFGEIIKAAELKPGDRVLDLYSGVGAISLQLAHAARELQPPVEVWGVESVTQAVLDARLNADINRLSGLTFVEADASSWLEDYEANPDQIPFDLILVDPPRKGLDPRSIDILLASSSPRLVYVSCNPASLARDLSLLNPAYRVESVQPVDMFPRTTHVETVVLMSRNG